MAIAGDLYSYTQCVLLNTVTLTLQNNNSVILINFMHDSFVQFVYKLHKAIWIHEKEEQDQQYKAR